MYDNCWVVHFKDLQMSKIKKNQMVWTSIIAGMTHGSHEFLKVRELSNCFVNRNEAYSSAVAEQPV